MQKLLLKEDNKFQQKEVMGKKLITYEGKIYVPKSLQSMTLNWFHHYLQHPGATRMEKTIRQSLYWPSMSADCKRVCKYCRLCQFSKRLKRKYKKIPPKDPDWIPWHSVCVDCIGPLTIQSRIHKKKVKYAIQALTMIDPATGWFEICPIPLGDFNSSRVSQLFNQYWLARYPRPVMVIHDNGNEFKKGFLQLLKDFGIKSKPTTVKNPQANGIIERVHGVINDMLRDNDLEHHDFDPVDPWEDLLANIALGNQMLI